MKYTKAQYLDFLYQYHSAAIRRHDPSFAVALNRYAKQDGNISHERIVKCVDLLIEKGVEIDKIEVSIFIND